MLTVRIQLCPFNSIRKGQILKIVNALYILENSDSLLIKNKGYKLLDSFCKQNGVFCFQNNCFEF